MVLALASGLIVFFVAGGLLVKAWPILSSESIATLLFSSAWKPMKGLFGFWPFLMGTLWVTGVAVVIAVPLCLLTAIYLSEYAHRWVREWAMPLIDLLAGIPSVVYGVWGILMIVPLVKDHIAPRFGAFSSDIRAHGRNCSGDHGLSGDYQCDDGSVQVGAYEMRLAALSMGATRWQMIKSVVLRKGLPGIIAACVLGLSRAFGETMAVLMLVGGSRPRVPEGLLDSAYPLPALIANNYGEMLTIPKYDSALMLAALLLMLIVVVFNIFARVILVRVEKWTQ